MEKQIQKIRQKIKFNRGSILAVSLIILGIMLISALSFSLVTIQERKASIGENTSNQAYTTAETGVEKVMQKMKDNEGLTLAEIDTDGNCDGTFNSTAGYTVKFKNSADEFITDCGTPIALVKTVKSIGTAGGNQRAVEVAVADTCKGGVQVVASGSAWGSSSYNDVKDFVTNPDGKIVGFLCSNSTLGDVYYDGTGATFVDFIDFHTGHTESNILTVAGGYGVWPLYCRNCSGGYCDPQMCDICRVSNQICSTWTILGSCTCANSCTF